MFKKKFLFKSFIKQTTKLGISNYYVGEILFLNLNSISFSNNSLKKIYKKKQIKPKKLCVILIKRRDFFIILHVYIANKLVYVTNFEENFKQFKFHKFAKFYIFKIIKKLLYYKQNFNKIIFIFKLIKKTRKIRKKINFFKKNNKKPKRKRKKTFIQGFFFKKLILYASLLKKIQIKFLYNLSHSLIREKFKKKRRK